MVRKRYGKEIYQDAAGADLIGRLLHAVVVNVGANQRIEDRQDVPAVLQHAREDVAQLRLAFRFFVPFGENQSRHFDVLTELFRGMAAQKEAVEESGFALREVKVVNDFRGNDLWQGSHREKCSLPKKFSPSSSTRGLLPPLEQLPVPKGEAPGRDNWYNWGVVSGL